MDSKINYLILDGNNVSKTVDSKLDLLKENGFSDETNANLKSALQDLKTKETAQVAAVEGMQEKTAEQDKIIAEIHSLVKRIRNAVRSAYEEDQTKLAQFKVDEEIPSSLKNIRSLCEYLHPVVVKESTALLKNGLLQSDIDDLGNSSARILTIDSEQELTKKIQQSATIARNDAAKVFKKQLKKIRNFVKARFDNKPEISVLFEPIPKGRGGSEEKTTATNTTTDNSTDTTKTGS